MRYGLLNDWRRLDKSRLSMTVQRFCALAYPKEYPELPETPLPALMVDPDNAFQAASDLGLKSEEAPISALCPGAEFGPAKQWPASHYAQLADHYGQLGWQIWLFGSEKDRPVCGDIQDAASTPCQNLAGKTSLAQAVDLLSLASAVVSNDSGLMHIAAALDRPLVALYGSSDPNFTPPLSPKAQVLSLGLECSPCFKRQCPLGHLDCLTRITPNAVADLLGNPAT
jgi:heptosyltransferase-2